MKLIILTVIFLSLTAAIAQEDPTPSASKVKIEEVKKEIPKTEFKQRVLLDLSQFLSLDTKKGASISYQYHFRDNMTVGLNYKKMKINPLFSRSKYEKSEFDVNVRAYSNKNAKNFYAGIGYGNATIKGESYFAPFTIDKDILTKSNTLSENNFSYQAGYLFEGTTHKNVKFYIDIGLVYGKNNNHRTILTATNTTTSMRITEFQADTLLYSALALAF